MSRADRITRRATAHWARPPAFIPGRLVLWSRVQLARAVLSHRPWCDRCAPHARQALGALDGKSIQELADSEDHVGGGSVAGSRSASA